MLFILIIQQLFFATMIPDFFGNESYLQELDKNQLNVHYNVSSKTLQFFGTGYETETYILNATLLFKSYESHTLHRYNSLDINEEITIINNTLSFNVELENILQTDYTLLEITFNNTVYKHPIFIVNDVYPIHFTKLQLDKPQWMQLTNTTNSPYFLDTLHLKGTGNWKAIPIHTLIEAGQSIKLSKHDVSQDIYDESIPYLYTNNVTYYIKLFGIEDSIHYSANDIPFYTKGNVLTPKSIHLYNHENIWEVDRYGEREKASYQLKITNNPFSPDLNETLTVSLNYSEFDLIQLKIYDFDGIEIYRFQDSPTYFGVKTWHWDGKDKQGRFVKRGPYILHFKGRKNGVWETKKYSIAVYRK